ncbi:UDP-glucosyltransferase 2-like [Panulirus ornatus]|uniref:UDP-glucosyltransferase 2-like n=1 Tax=Panulirus ornatus TaxID=150431 RepID=UPI003A860812
MRWWSVVSAAVAVVQVVEAARILMVAPVGSISHKIFYMSIAEALSTRNHTVTFLTGCKPSKPRRNIREVYVPGVNLYDELSQTNIFNLTLHATSWKFISYLPKSCADSLASKEMQRVQEEEFDLVVLSIVGIDCFYPYVHKLQVPYIHMSPNALLGSYSDVAGNPHFPSIVGNRFLEQEYPLTFTNRMFSTLIEVIWRIATLYYFYPRIEEECTSRQLWPDDAPSLTQMRINGSLIIINSVKTMETPTSPYVPTVIHAGGIHCQPAQPLPQELDDWVAGAGDAGFIFFSLGSFVKPSLVPEKYQKLLLQVFSSLEQRVLWKWDQDAMDNMPANVRLSKWLPQQDVLGDPRLRLFITHGGLLSTQEATYHGVPLLGLPVFLDQQYNMEQVQREGWGRLLQWDNLTYDNLRQNILDIIHDTSLREEVSRRSALMRDQPMPVVSWVTYWVEYVMRYNGAYHLRCPAYNMPWYELYNVDAWLLVVMVLALVSFLSFKLLIAVCTCLCSAKKRKQD